MAYTICFLTAFVVLLFFLVYGLMHVSNVPSYFNCDRQLGWFEFGNSFAAASTSLATVLFFFVTLGLTNGLYILFSPLSFLIGTELFTRYMLPRLKQQKYCVANEGEKTIGNTLGQYIKQRYDSKMVKSVVLMITLLGILSIMLIELYVGVQIFDIFLKPEYEDYALYFIAFVTFIYTGLGGLNAVVKTDKIQFLFMSATALILVIYLFVSYDNSLGVKDFFPPLLNEHGSFALSLPLYANMLFVNALLVPSLLRNWQLIAATKSENEIRKGFKNGVGMTAGISLLFVVFGIFFYNIFEHAPQSMNGILTTMADSHSLFLSNVMFPMLFAACLMALLSTVDSSLLPVVQCLAEDIFPSVSQKRRKTAYTFYMLGTLFVTIFLYGIIFKHFKFDIISWLFTIFSLVTIASPAILFGCFGNETVLRTRLMQYTVVLCTILGLAIALAISFWGNNPDGDSNIALIQLNTPIAITISSVLISIVYLYERKNTHKD